MPSKESSFDVKPGLSSSRDQSGSSSAEDTQAIPCAGPGVNLAHLAQLQLCLLSPAPRWTWFSRGSLLQGARQEEEKYEDYGPDVPFPKATMSHRSRLGVARLDACSHRKRILAGAVPSPRSIPRPLLPRIPWRAAQPRCSAAPACLPACTKWLTQLEAQVAQVCVPSSSQLTCSDLSRGRRICPFLSGFSLPGEKGEKGLGKGKHSLSSCKSQQPKGSAGDSESRGPADTLFSASHRYLWWWQQPGNCWQECAGCQGCRVHPAKLGQGD